MQTGILRVQWETQKDEAFHPGLSWSSILPKIIPKYFFDLSQIRPDGLHLHALVHVTSAPGWETNPKTNMVGEGNVRQTSTGETIFVRTLPFNLEPDG